ncbi:helix-turn-helix domain-containing protein [Paractinoplanes rhizophilus]|uniref:Helix-turn-helix domain-containing protein n=1 Tax=Paractinoplanes rhizophilus TaxID=1416877 RepID=A0ABW2HQ96_9ACTN
MPENNPPSGTREAVARAVREAMARKKISGRALADQLGMPQSVFSRRMTGEVAFTVDELAAIAAELEEPLTGLLAGVPAVGAA